jgi:hypothetical protein
MLLTRGEGPLAVLCFALEWSTAVIDFSALLPACCFDLRLPIQGKMV